MTTHRYCYYYCIDGANCWQAALLDLIYFLGKYLNELSGCEQRPNAFLNMID